MLVPLMGDRRATFVLMLILCSIMVTLTVNVGTHVVKADSNDYIQFSAFTLYSPLNITYNSRSLTLNLTFGAAIGIKYPLYYEIDGKYEGPIPYMITNPNETHVVYKATGFVELRELSEGSHNLTIHFIAAGYQPEGLSYADTVYFTIASGAPRVDTTPPSISDLSIGNKTYTISNVSLAFTVSEPTLGISYSLDGQENVAIDGNTTLTELSDGSHSLIVYATDTSGNRGASETVYFSIDVPQPEPLEPLLITWITAATTIIAIVGAALLVYFRKTKRTTLKGE